MLWKRIIECKLDNQANVLAGSGHEREAEMLASYAGEVRADDSTGREAAGARRYFQAMFGADFIRLPHAGATNNALDYGYSILLSHTACRIAAKGYLNQVGIHHHSKTNPYDLACDLMEPF
ncbi:MAG: type II CRISPR-associated endonuclease Cas1, partial [Alistipes sp.]|uniref:type II CRISPR-associated endonuclease Cas1 n=1 Tax=Alistipes sp. TaxID=1872444 RepID=UPI001DFCDF60